MNEYDVILNTIEQLKPIESVERVSGGLSHHCFKVYSSEKQYFVKILDTSTTSRPEHHKNYQHQKLLQEHAFESGLSPKLICADTHSRYWVFEYLTGRQINREIDGDNNVIDSLLDVMVKTHQIKAPLTSVNLPVIIEDLLKVLLERALLTEKNSKTIWNYFNYTSKILLLTVTVLLFVMVI